MQNMIQALRLARTQSPALTLTPPTLHQQPANLGKRGSRIRFRQAATQSTEPGSDQNMEDKAHNPDHQTGDVMSHSFGVGYSTRSDEEGFGGIYGRNEWVPKTGDQGQLIHENHPAYDKTQGSEVKEKEKSRHQTSA